MANSHHSFFADSAEAPIRISSCPRSRRLAALQPAVPPRAAG